MKYIHSWSWSKQIPLDPHLTFCYSTLNKVSKTFSLIIQQLGTELRDAVLVSLPLSLSNMCVCVYVIFSPFSYSVCLSRCVCSTWFSCWLVLHKNNIDPSLFLRWDKVLYDRKLISSTFSGYYRGWHKHSNWDQGSNSYSFPPPHIRSWLAFCI